MITQKIERSLHYSLQVKFYSENLKAANIFEWVAYWGIYQS